MRSTRVLTLLLVVLVLVPAGILGWLGVRGTDRFEAELRERLQQELGFAASSVKNACDFRPISDAVEAEHRVAFAADLLSRRLPFDEPGRALAEAKAALSTRHQPGSVVSALYDPSWAPTAVELRILDDRGRVVLPVPFDPDGGAGGRRSDPDRLFDDLAREAEILAFGREDPAGAVEVWRRAAARFTLPTWQARAEIEALSLVAGIASASEEIGAQVSDLERRYPLAVLEAVGRPWVLLLLRASASPVARGRLRALSVEGRLTEMPMTEAERDRVREVLGEGRARIPASEGAGSDVHRAPLPSGLVLEVTRRWPRLLDSPAGVLFAWIRRTTPWDVELRGERPRTIRWDARQRPLLENVELPRSGGQGAWIVLRHQDEARSMAEVAEQRRATIAGVLSLVGVIGLGLVLGRSALAREREARRLKDDFLANVSHELRTPLTSVCLHADLLAEPGLAEPQRRAHAEVVRAEGARLSALVDDLLDFAALERGSRRLEPEPVDLAAAAERAIAPFRVLADREGASLTLDLAPGELLAMADPHALGRILSNLVGNAWKHGRPSRDGGPGRLGVRVGAADGRPAIDVVDDGPGIPAAEPEHLFERFRRGAAAGKTRGVGLGLALSRDLARALGGDLAVVEDPTRTVFRLTLPPVSPPPPEPTTGIPA